MKHKLLMICCATAVMASCNSETKDTKTEGTTDATPAATEKASEKKEQAWIPVDSAQAERAMMEAGTPGEPHKMLAKSVGTWNAEMTHWMGEGKPGVTGTGKSVGSSLFDGRYHQTKFTGDLMGWKFEGTGIMGYDNTEKKYFSTWVDNMSTGMMMTWGTWDEASKTFTFTGTMKNPANGLDCHLRETFKIVDDKTQVMEMYGPDPKTGKEYKMMEIKYTKK